jgi:hypothetical protein
VHQAQAIIDAIGDIPGIRKPIVRPGRTHVYYTIPFLIELQESATNGDVNNIAKARNDFCRSLESDDVPIVQGYFLPCIACRLSRSLRDPSRRRNVSMMVNFSISKIVNGPLTKHRY